MWRLMDFTGASVMLHIFSSAVACGSFFMAGNERHLVVN